MNDFASEPLVQKPETDRERPALPVPADSKLPPYCATRKNSLAAEALVVNGFVAFGISCHKPFASEAICNFCPAVTGDHEIERLVPVRVAWSVGRVTGAESRIPIRSTRSAVGLGVAGALFILKSSVFTPATRPLVIVNELKLPNPGAVIPVLTPFNTISVPVLSTAQPPTILTLERS